MGSEASPLAMRRQRLAERLARRNLDGCVLVPGPNLRYFTGLEVESGERPVLWVLGLGGHDLAVVPYFEAERVRQALPGCRLITYRDEAGPEPAVARAFGAMGLRPLHLGAEFGTMRLMERAVIEGSVPKARWHPVDADAYGLRQCKDAQEVESIRRASAVAGEAMAEGLGVVRAGVSEAEVAQRCLAVLASHGTVSPFGVMVASGPRSADPHATTSGRQLQEGDLVWIDLGARVEGYVADITRTVAVGEVRPELRSALDAAAAAQRAAIEAARPGRTAGEVDHAARGVMNAAGLGAYFTHRTGHGLGLEVHEPPFIVDGSVEPLQPGMIFTVEPGAYLPGEGGARIEDDVLVTADGLVVLTQR